MVKQNFEHIETWVFDLDNTLYPAQMALFNQIEAKMTAFVMRELKVPEVEANHLRKRYWHEFGTTLAGLMEHHGVDPEPYLHEVHDISFHPLKEDPHLRSIVSDLKGRKIVYTNGSKPYAEKVLRARGLEGVFDDIFGVEHADYVPKPSKAAFEMIFEKAKILPAKAAMFEDDLRNLVVPHALGMRTVHIAPERHEAAHVDHHCEELSRFLSHLTDAA